MRHFWVDRIVDFERGTRVSGIKCVSLSEDVFEDHFPGNPVLPGIYLVEGVAQTAGYLLHETADRSKIAVLGSIDRARFLAFARPGDQLRFDVRVESLTENAARVAGEVIVDARRIASLRLTFHLLPPDRLIASPYRPFWEAQYAQWRGEFPGETRQ
jgi:3-hydroxyacyl-[acyl-carrier-protein] dehydratase